MISTNKQNKSKYKFLNGTFVLVADEIGKKEHNGVDGGDGGKSGGGSEGGGGVVGMCQGQRARPRVKRPTTGIS